SWLRVCSGWGLGSRGACRGSRARRGRSVASMAAALSRAQGCAPPAGVAGGARDGGARGVAGVGDRAVSLVFAGWLPQSACFVAGGRVLRSGVAGLAAHSHLARGGGALVPGAAVRAVGLWRLRLLERGGGPEEADQLACGGDGGDAGVASASAQPVVGAVEALLGAVGEREHLGRPSFLSAVERDADAGRALVVPGGFGQAAAGVPAAGLGDRAAAGRLAGLLEAGDEAEPGGELGGAEALPVDDLELERERGQRVDAAEAAQASDGRPELGSLRDAGEPLVEVCAAGEQAVDVRDQLGERERRVGLVELLR